MRRRAIVTIASIAALLGTATLAACSEPASAPTKATGTTDASTQASAKECAADLLACAKGSTVEPYLPSKPTKATGTPIVLGMVNQENTAAGSYPELSQGTQAAHVRSVRLL